jgi:hypothetical protein
MGFARFSEGGHIRVQPRGVCIWSQPGSFNTYNAR